MKEGNLNVREEYFPKDQQKTNAAESKLHSVKEIKL